MLNTSICPNELDSPAPPFAFSPSETAELAARGIFPLNTPFRFFRANIARVGNMQLHTKAFIRRTLEGHVYVLNSVNVYRNDLKDHLSEWSQSKYFATLKDALDWLGPFQTPPDYPPAPEERGQAPRLC